MKTTLTTLILLTIFASCKKFQHENVPLIPKECELCEWADRLEGEFHGVNNAVGYSSLGSHINYDTIQVDVEHIFLNHGPEDDSTYMYFHLTFSGSEYIENKKYLCVAYDSSGVVHHSGFNQFELYQDSIFFSNSYPYTSVGGFLIYHADYGTLYR